MAVRGKGAINFLRRGVSIARRYGITPRRMNRALEQFAAVLRQFGCSATFPITSVALQRNPDIVRKHQAQSVEFALHGYCHLDYSRLSQAEQLAHLALAKRGFAGAGIQAQGFRSPYLRWNPDMLAALRQQGLAYDSSQALAWNVLNDHETLAYRRVLGFYGALSASGYPSLPSLEDDLVRIPYSLPDDEALVERLTMNTSARMSAPWLAILRRTHELGELFTLGLHPERIDVCREPLVAALSEARTLVPAVWIARLDEIAAWWRARAGASVQITAIEDCDSHVQVTGPSGTVVLARGVRIDAPVERWADDYWQVKVTDFIVHAPCRPFIGVSPIASSDMVSFLRQQGYIVEVSTQVSCYSYYFDQTSFAAEDKRPLLAQIEETDHPLVRLARWPDGARSALTITGDIDALTLWDYGLRFLGR
jgi:peptidoglycan/xylan/chitin deacetylase (PgdA/CDA1 family)